MLYVCWDTIKQEARLGPKACLDTLEERNQVFFIIMGYQAKEVCQLKLLFCGIEIKECIVHTERGFCVGELSSS